MPSELRVDKVSSTTSPYDPVFSTTGGALSHRNMIINGAMLVAQRGTSVTDVNQVSTYFNADRWKHWESTAGQYQTSLYSMSTAEHNTTGHTKAIKLNVKTNNAVSSLGAGAYAFVGTILEGQDLQHLQYGTANAKTLTISFWVKSNKTGTYVLNLNKADSTVTRIPMEYTINTANTWEKKTITITPTQGSTSLITASGGAIDNNNGIGFEILWVLAVGSTYSGGTANTWSANVNHIGTSNQVNWMDTDTNDFYLTGVQLELGTVATPFEHRSYSDELLRCQRYYQKIENTASGTEYFASMQAYNGGAVYGVVKDYVTTMRAEPHTVTSGGTFGAYQAGSSNAGSTTGISGLIASPISWLSTGFGTFSGLSAGDAVVIFWHANAYLTADAEL